MWNLNDSPDPPQDESDSRENRAEHVSNYTGQSTTWLSSVPQVTRNFFPSETMEPEVRQIHGSSGFSRSQSVGKSDPSGSSRPEELAPEISRSLKKSRRGPRSRSSQYRGVTFYRRTGRWESHIWDCGKQVYLGGFDTAYAAACTYDRAAIKFRGVDADINFHIEDYVDDFKQMGNLTKEELIHVLRRQSTGLPRGSSRYRGVTLHKCGRWESRLGQFLNKKAYDKAAIKSDRKDTVTNFDLKEYEEERSLEKKWNDHNLDLSLGKSNSEVYGFKYESASITNRVRDEERLLGSDLSLATTTTAVRSEKQTGGGGKREGVTGSFRILSSPFSLAPPHF